MGTELEAHAALDFSSYRPGDVFCISKREIAKQGHAHTYLFLAELAKAAGKVGLLIETTFDDANDELRVLFK